MACSSTFKALLASICVASLASAQRVDGAKAVPASGARFAEPVLVLAGQAPMGARRLYPSPALQDMNGDGRADIVLGDLWGKLTVAPRLAGDGPATFGPDQPLLARDGTPLDFKNW